MLNCHIVPDELLFACQLAKQIVFCSSSSNTVYILPKYLYLSHCQQHPRFFSLSYGYMDKGDLVFLLQCNGYGCDTKIGIRNN